MHDEEYTEDLLHLHEKEIERLEEEVESKKNILPKVREWFKLVEDEEELERNEKDPNRFSRRGGAMLREEKLRKRVNVLKPKIEMDLLSLLPTWEEENGRPFIVSGRRVVDRIHDAMEEKELVKEAKKVSLFFFFFMYTLNTYLHSYGLACETRTVASSSCRRRILTYTCTL